MKSRVGLLADYERVRQWTCTLVESLSAEDQMVQSMPDASPTKWHLAHATWFFETFLLGKNLAGYKPFDPNYKVLFNSYYKRLGKHPVRSTRGTFSRPSLEDVWEYRRVVDAGMQKLLSGDLSPEVAALVELGLNHEQQHQELVVTDIKHAFWSQPLRPAYRPGASVPSQGSERRWNSFRGGLVEIGHTGDGFAFDNESPRHQVFLNPFRLASRPVSNAEYLDFINDGGYERPELWLSDGWDTVCAQGWEAPLYWEREEDTWHLFTAAGMRRVDPNDPVCHVSYYEADAFARWVGARLPLETEWETVAETLPIEGQFAESLDFHPRSGPEKGTGMHQMYGCTWEWMASPYVGYPGFRPAAGVVGEYNGKFMCNQFVLRGGSCATPRSHLRASYRNFFPPHARWQFMGIRLAADER
ncbi:MAG: ergothioneine biosynthesis protein EgtB [Acidobacteriaceae bacterium]